MLRAAELVGAVGGVDGGQRAGAGPAELALARTPFDLTGERGGEDARLALNHDAARVTEGAPDDGNAGATDGARPVMHRLGARPGFAPAATGEG